MEETEQAFPANKTYELFSSFVYTNDDKGKIQKTTATIRELMKEFRVLPRGAGGLLRDLDPC